MLRSKAAAFLMLQLLLPLYAKQKKLSFSKIWTGSRLKTDTKKLWHLQKNYCIPKLLPVRADKFVFYSDSITEEDQWNAFITQKSTTWWWFRR
jgi:hypothetical protein